MSIDPPLWVFHDVLYDSEIEVIKRIAKPMVNKYSNNYEQFGTQSDIVL